MCDESVQVAPIAKKVKQTQLLSYRKPHSKNFNFAFHHYARRIQKYNRSPFPICSIFSPMNIGGPLRGWSTIIGPCGKTGVAGRIGRNRCRCGKHGGWHGPVTCGGAM